MAYVQSNSPFSKKGDAPSRKKSLGYYNKAKDSGTGAAAGGGMSLSLIHITEPTTQERIS